MTQQKIDKHQGATTTCTTCGMDLICLPFEFQGQKTLSWCDKGTNVKHYDFDQTKEKPSCRYEPILKQLELLKRVDAFIKKHVEDPEQQKLYTHLIFNKLYK